ncbi:hypothetical protein [Pseudoflavonifractor gallinarum]|uniref:hypothetical protein n=1 Tax=Pseudoflavonifractor gallinarum TaxID=2779352 RepID=UPI0036F35C54
MEFLTEIYRGQYTVLQVDTGDSPATIPFYESCSFRRHQLVKNFFTGHYDHPLYECGVRLVDMVYLQKSGGKVSKQKTAASHFSWLAAASVLSWYVMEAVSRLLCACGAHR